jgi:hypothetical protein
MVAPFDLTPERLIADRLAIHTQYPMRTPSTINSRTEFYRRNEISQAEPTIPLPFPLIPVIKKDPHVRGYSYAIAQSAISKALSGLSMFEAFALSYSNQSPITETEAATELPFLRVTCTNYPVYEPKSNMSAGFRGGEHWAIEVLLTPYNHREFVRRLMERRALPELRKWLEESASGPRDLKRQAKTCWYFVPTNEIEWMDA